MTQKDWSLFTLGLFVLICGIATPLQAHPQAPLRVPVHYAGEALNRGLLYLQAHHYFLHGNKGDEKTGLNPLFEGFSDGSGMSGGLQFTQPLLFGANATVSGSLSTRLYQRYGLRFTKRLGAFETGPGIRFTVLSEEDFFGEGSASRNQDRTNFSLSERTAHWLTDAKFGRVRLRHDLSWTRYDISDGRDERFPSTIAFFKPSQVTGGFDRTRWLTNEVGAMLDFRDDAKNPKSGAALDASIARATGLGANTSKLTAVRSIQTAYVPLTAQRFHVLALRAEAVHNFGSDPVPFFMQPTLGGSGTLRGFREFRFRDRDALAFTAEYRYRVWRYIDATVFSDFGQVYGNLFKEFTDRRLQAAGGMGLRLDTPIGLRLRMSIGHSHEGNRLFVGLGSTW